jgi:hypothetical protein
MKLFSKNLILKKICLEKIICRAGKYFRDMGILESTLEIIPWYLKLNNVQDQQLSYS